MAFWEPFCKLPAAQSLDADFSEERRLGYVAITRGMRRVTISHCAVPHGPNSPSLFQDELPEPHRVRGWLHARTGDTSMAATTARHAKMTTAELAQKFA